MLDRAEIETGNLKTLNRVVARFPKCAEHDTLCTLEIRLKVPILTRYLYRNLYISQSQKDSFKQNEYKKGLQTKTKTQSNKNKIKRLIKSRFDSKVLSLV